MLDRSRFVQKGVGKQWSCTIGLTGPNLCFGAYCDIYLARLSVMNVNGRSYIVTVKVARCLGLICLERQGLAPLLSFSTS